MSKKETNLQKQIEKIRETRDLITKNLAKLDGYAARHEDPTAIPEYRALVDFGTKLVSKLLFAYAKLNASKMDAALDDVAEQVSRIVTDTRSELKEKGAKEFMADTGLKIFDKAKKTGENIFDKAKQKLKNKL